jgi:chaperonin GroEL (HSP60 family)
VVLESKYGSPKIVNDGVTIAREVRRRPPQQKNLDGHCPVAAAAALQARQGAGPRLPPAQPRKST